MPVSLAWSGCPLLLAEAHPLSTAIVCGAFIIGGVKSLFNYFNDNHVDNVDDDDDDNNKDADDDFAAHVANQRKYLAALRNIRGRPPIRPDVDWRNHQPDADFLRFRQRRNVVAGA